MIRAFLLALTLCGAAADVAIAWQFTSAAACAAGAPYQTATLFDQS